MIVQDSSIFNSQTQAAQQLAARLTPGLHREVIVVCVSAAGFPFADALAGALHAASLYVPSVEIHDPANPRRVIGAVNFGSAVMQEQRDLPADYVYRQTRRLQEDLKRQSPGQSLVFDKVLRAKDVIIVDDVIQDPSMIQAAIRLVSEFDPAVIIVAAPIVTHEAMEQLNLDADEVFALDTFPAQVRVS